MVAHTYPSASAWASSAAASMRAFICRAFRRCATPTCAAYGVRIPSMRVRRPRWRAVSTSARRKALRLDPRHGGGSHDRCAVAHRPQPHAPREHGGNRARHRGRPRARCAASRARSRWRALSRRPSACIALVRAHRRRARLSGESGIRAADRNRPHAASGRAARRAPAGPILRALPRSTAGRMPRGSGAASCRAAACSTT